MYDRGRDSIGTVAWFAADTDDRGGTVSRRLRAS
jgi:hypothetical protein